jgi:hypothetical protein
MTSGDGADPGSDDPFKIAPNLNARTLRYCNLRRVPIEVNDERTRAWRLLWQT